MSKKKQRKRKTKFEAGAMRMRIFSTDAIAIVLSVKSPTVTISRRCTSPTRISINKQHIYIFFFNISIFRCTNLVLLKRNKSDETRFLKKIGIFISYELEYFSFKQFSKKKLLSI